MLFALIDLTKYLCKVGPYSARSLTGIGAIYASPAAFDAFNASARLGDQLFVHPRLSLVSWAIMYLTNGPWSHVGTLMGNGEVCEAVTSGVGVHRLERYFDGRHYLRAVQLFLSDDEGLRARAYIQSEIGKPYAWRKIRRLFLMTICNEHPDYRFRFTIDLLILLFLPVFLVKVRPVQLFAVSLAVVYLLILGVNSFNRLRAMLRLHRDYLEFASPKSHEAINSSPNRFYRQLLRAIPLRRAGKAPRNGGSQPTTPPTPGGI